MDWHIVWLQFLSAGLHGAHLVVIFINCCGFATPWTRRCYPAVILATLLSWCVGGLFYGFGYCFLTDWHWEVLYRLEERDLPASYLQYLSHLWFQLPLSALASDLLIGVGVVFGLLGFWRTKRRDRKI